MALNHSLRDKQAAVLVTADAQHSGTKQTAQQTVRQSDSGTDSETGNPVFIGHNNHVLLSICKFALRFSLFLVFYSVFFFFLLSFYVHANWIAVTTGAISIFIEFSLNFQ